MKKQWLVKHADPPKTLEELKAILLKNRGIDDHDGFINVKEPGLLNIEETGINPLQMEKAVERLWQAHKQQEDVLVFGDYDADGITATAILWLTLHKLGFKSRPFVPHREKHGYGISDRALDEILTNRKPDLIVTVDNGIVAHATVERLRAEDVDVIITDHHQPETTKKGKVQLPKALAVVHTTKLCGATVSWMLARELDKEYTRYLLDLAGIATIADQVQLTGANRSFAKFGLEALKKTKRIGLLKLLEAAGIDQKKITAATVGYSIAPRINAMGRLEHGMDALRLLCTNNKARATELAALLMQTNVRRQDITDDLLTDAIQQVQNQQDEHIIIVSSHDYHEGVIGLIAGRLTEQFYKPAIAISLNGGVGKASARSVSGVNIVELLRQVRDDLLEVGGHPMAAGFGLEMSKLKQVRDKLFALAKSEISPDQLIPNIAIDCSLPFSFVRDDTVEFVETLSPFGQGNEQPIFKLESVTVIEAKPIGRNNSHLKILVRDDLDDSNGQGNKLQVLAWQKGEQAAELGPGTAISLAGKFEFNYWNGRRSIQMIMEDLKQVSGDELDATTEA